MPPGGGQGPRKIASIGVHVSRWVTTHGYALNVDLDPAPFTEWITACGLEDAAFTTMARELERPVDVEEVRPAAIAAIAEVFGLELDELPADDGAGLWPQPVHASARRAMTVRHAGPVPAAPAGMRTASRRTKAASASSARSGRRARRSDLFGARSQRAPLLRSNATIARAHPRGSTRAPSSSDLDGDGACGTSDRASETAPSSARSQTSIKVAESGRRGTPLAADREPRMNELMVDGLRRQRAAVSLIARVASRCRCAGSAVSASSSHGSKVSTANSGGQEIGRSSPKSPYASCVSVVSISTPASCFSASSLTG